MQRLGLINALAYFCHSYCYCLFLSAPSKPPPTHVITPDETNHHHLPPQTPMLMNCYSTLHQTPPFAQKVQQNHGKWTKRCNNRRVDQTSYWYNTFGISVSSSSSMYARPPVIPAATFLPTLKQTNQKKKSFPFLTSLCPQNRPDYRTIITSKKSHKPITTSQLLSAQI